MSTSAPLSLQDEEAWELFCDHVTGSEIDFWHQLGSSDRLHFRLLANAERIDRNQPWRHP